MCTSMPYVEKSILFCNQYSENDLCNITQNQISEVLLFSNYNQLLNKSQKLCDLNPSDSISCAFMSNYCILISESTDYCNRFRGMSTNYSCIQYQQSYTEVLRDIIIPHSYDYSTNIKIILAVFSSTGKFIEYSPLKTQIQNCGSRHNKRSLWRQFGRNYYEKCSLNISKLSLNFYEPFLYIEDQNLLIQIPVLPQNYIRNGIRINEKEEVNYQFFNRFFLYDNYSLKKTQYASEISFIFKIREDNHKQMHVPYLLINYESVYNFNEIQRFKFSAKYLLSDNFFTNFAISIIIIAFILAIFYFIASLLMLIRTLVSDGINKHFIFSVLSILFSSIGYALFFSSFILGFYILCRYKWTNHLSMCLESTNHYNFLVIFVYASLFFVFISIILLLINQSNGTFHAIDWDQRSSLYNSNRKSHFISKSRQDIAANEWLKISTVRGIDTPFIILFVLLIIRGCKMYLLQQPIPTTEKIDAGKKYIIIEIGLTSFVWLLSILLFWFLKRFVYWNVFGNPFTNFQQICLSLNISAIMMMNNTRGFLINGKQILDNSASELTNPYDKEILSDPENKIQEKDENDNHLGQFDSIHSSKMSGIQPDDLDNKEKNNYEIKIFIDKNDNESGEKSIKNINNSNFEQAEPQRVQVDYNFTNNRKQQLPASKDLRVKFIEKDYKNIDNVGMENDDSGPIKGYTWKDKKEKNSDDDTNNGKDSDVDVEINIDSDSDSLLEHQNKPENKSSIIDSDIQEEEEETGSITEDDKTTQQTSKLPIITENIQEDENSNHEKKHINNMSTHHENTTKPSNSSNAHSPSYIAITNNLNNFDSNVINDNIQTASKALKKFQFKSVNLLEEESESDENLSLSSSDIISDYSEIIPSGYSKSQSSAYSDNQKAEVLTKKREIPDIFPQLDPLDKKAKGKNQVFEIFLEPEFFHYVNKCDYLIDLLLDQKKNRIYSATTKSIAELREETTSTWREILLNENPDFSYFIEEMSLAQYLFKIGPVSKFESIFTIQRDSSFKESMLYGIEGSLMLFYLILFISIESFSNASIAGLIVFLVDTMILKLFKWKRRKYLLDRKFSPYKSLVR